MRYKLNENSSENLGVEVDFIVGRLKLESTDKTLGVGVDQPDFYHEIVTF